MANKIILKKSSTAGKAPVPGDLDYGELALNYNDGRLFFKNSSNLIRLFGLRFTSESATSGTLTINSDTTDIYSATGLTGAVTIAAPTKDVNSSGPYDGQRLVIRLEDAPANNPRLAIAINSWATGTSGSFRAVGVTLPTTTTAGKVTYIGCIYNATDLRWDVVAVAQEA